MEGYAVKCNSCEHVLENLVKLRAEPVHDHSDEGQQMLVTHDVMRQFVIHKDGIQNGGKQIRLRKEAQNIGHQT